MAPPDVIPLTIPQDIIFGILDYCRDDVLTLKSCALVSHAWVPIAQRHLFSRTTIDGDPDCPGRDTPSFLSLLRQSPTFRNYIRTLEIISDEITLPDIWELVDHLPGLRSLKLDRLNILSESCGVPYIPRSPPGHLETLFFELCEITKAEQRWRIVFDIANRFSSIENLHFLHLLEPDPDNPLLAPSSHQVHPQPTKTVIGNLHFHPNIVNTTDNLEFISTLLERIVMDQLQSMAIVQGTFVTNEQVETLINSAPKLKRLSIQLQQYVLHDEPTPGPVSLSAVHDLEVISFTIPLYRRGPDFPYYLQSSCSQLLAITSSLHSPLTEFQLEIITLSKNVTKTVQSVDWSQLECLLRRFKHLQVVQVRITAVTVRGRRASPMPARLPLDQGLVDTINEGFANLAHRCVVKVEVS